MSTRRVLGSLPCCFAAVSIALGCGGPSEPPAAANEPPAEAPSPAEPDDWAADEDEDETPDAVAEPEADDAPAPQPETAPEETPRDIVYKVTPEGLVISVEDLEVRPTVKPVRKGGGWAVEITAKMKATDEQMHRLLRSEKGPFMIAARVERGGETLELSDERGSEEEIFVTEGEPETFERTYPEQANDAFRAGDTALLFVGLWGLGVEADERRPVNKLFQVRLVVGKATPQPVIEPPASMR